MPSFARGPDGQRCGRPPGGSATRRCPAGRSRGEAHSAVIAGAAKPLAVTRSAPPLSSLRPVTSARSHLTWTLSDSPSCWVASSRKSARLRLLSMRTQAVCLHRSARTSAGTPAPLPRSTARLGVLSAKLDRAAANARLRSICERTGGGPRKPRCLASESRCASWERRPDSRRLAGPCPSVVSPPTAAAPAVLRGLSRRGGTDLLLLRWWSDRPCGSPRRALPGGRQLS